MKIRKTASPTKSGLELAEEVLHLLRMAPASVLATYFVGTIPFILGLLYFIADMDRSPLAAKRCGEEAFGMVVLFFWMKSWQTVYATGIRALLRGESAAPWTFRRAFRMVLDQIAVQSTAVIVFPIALLFTFPMPWVYAAYQNFSVLGDGADEPQGSLLKRSIKQAMLWRRQNIVLVWLLSPWMLFLAVATLLVTIKAIGGPGLVILLPLIPISLALSPVGIVLALNMGLLVYFVPMLLHKFLGVETMFLLSGSSAVFNSTFLATILSLAYLCMDPMMKAVYAARCFYGEALTTGDDLRVELRRRAGHGGAFIACGLIALMLSLASASFAVTPESAKTIAPHELNESINRVLSERQYSWQQPHAKPQSTEADDKGWLASFLDSLGSLAMRGLEWLQNLVKDIMDWIWDHLPRRKARESGHSNGWSMQGVNALLYSLLVLSILALIAVLVFYYRRAARIKSVEAKEVVAAIPDVEDESVTADRLPTDEWMSLAQSLIEKGEFRLALRALFLGNLAWLGHRELVRIARFKSNRDYLRELKLRAHVYPELPRCFSSSVALFERVWYGRLEADAELLGVFNGHSEGIRSCAE